MYHESAFPLYLTLVSRVLVLVLDPTISEKLRLS